jgi:hypothetical protein
VVNVEVVVMKGEVSAAFLLLAGGLAGCGGAGSGGTTRQTVTFTIGGFVNNLNSSPLKLQDNGGDTITVPTYGFFTFPTPLPGGSTYNVTILSQPPNGETCSVQSGTGTANANISSILVNCYPPITVGGAVFGLSGSGLALQNNGSDTLQIQSNGTFQFSSTIHYGQSYDVTVSAQPANPAQRCTVTNPSGSSEQSNVTNVLISCGSAEAKWAWMGGSQSTVLDGVYGQLGVPAAGNNPGARAEGTSWTDPSGNFWLFGGSNKDFVSNLNDLWRYSNGEWTWISGSSADDNQLGIYGTEGVPGTMNVPGARVDAASWTDRAGNLWLFGGYGVTPSTSYCYFNDLWKFSNNQWTWISGSSQPDQPPVYGTLGVAAAANVPGARSGAMTWVDVNGDLWLFGGFDVNIYGNGGSSRDQNDLWKFSGGKWTWMGGPNDPTTQAPGVYGTRGTPAAANIPGARADGATWTDASGAFWLFGGSGVDSAGTFGILNDLWRYKGGEWTWMSGSNVVGDLGTFGTMGVPDPANVPSARLGASAWVDSAGDFWIFGGGGNDRNGNDAGLNDLWRYSGGQWTYMSGSQLALQPPSYGPLGQVSAESLPGGCGWNVHWMDKAGRLWVYCLNDNDQEGLYTSANDLWMYQP